MIEKRLLENEKQFSDWQATECGEGVFASNEAPEKYPCLIVWREYDISNSMSYGCGVDHGFVYPSDFE